MLRLILCCLFLALSCSSPEKSTNLNLIYKRSAQYHLPDRNPIIVIPGILGSRLIDTNSGKVVWGAFSGKFADPQNSNDAQLISLPLQKENFKRSKKQVKPDGVLSSLRFDLLGIAVDIRAYIGILTTLGAGGYRDQNLGLNEVDYGKDHFTCFQFDYDWRRDNVENARRLKEFIAKKRAYIQSKYQERYGIKKADVKFDIVAHSMGGLLTRYFLRYGDKPLPKKGTLPKLTWAGTKDVERVILVGTPSAGASEAFEQLVHGFDIGQPLLPYYTPDILGTFLSIYQLLPRPRHKQIVFDNDLDRPIGDFYEAELWTKYKWGLASKDNKVTTFIKNALPHIKDSKKRRNVALEYQARALKKAKQFHQALDRPAKLPKGIDLYLVAGDSEPTPGLVSVDQKTGRVTYMNKIPGDGTVPRYSALMDERVGKNWKPILISPIDWSGVTFLPTTHIGLTTDPAFADNVLYKLLEDPRR